MASLVNKLLRFIPFLILLSTAWNVYTWYEDITAKKTELLDRKKSLQSKIKVDQKWLDGIQEFMNNIDQQEQQVAEVQKKIDLVQRQLPSNVSDTEILEFLSREAQVMNLQAVSLEPKEEVLNGFYYAKQFELKAQGTFHQFLVFFERMGDAERLFNIRKLEFKHAKDSQFRGRFQMIELHTVIESFRYNTDYKSETKKVTKK